MKYQDVRAMLAEAKTALQSNEEIVTPEIIEELKKLRDMLKGMDTPATIAGFPSVATILDRIIENEDNLINKGIGKKYVKTIDALLEHPMALTLIARFI